MSDVVLLFPGQGVQHVGMGRALAAEHPEARAVFEEADDALGFSLSRLCWDGPEEELAQTELAQPAILTHAVAALRASQLRDPGPVAGAAGHSLGEWGALVAADVLDFADAVRLVRGRGRAMQAAAPHGVGAMSALHGLERDVVERLCEEVTGAGQVVAVASHNGPGNVVVSGDRGAVERVGALATERGASGVIPLAVSAPFHSPLMASAAGPLAAALAGVALREPAFPIRSTIIDGWLSEAAAIPALLVAQLTAPVLWHEAISALAASGARRAVALGPASSLRGMVRRVARTLKVEVFGAD